MTIKSFLTQALGWGFVLWLIGYILGFALFFLVPQPLIGWVIMPIGLLVTLFVLYKKILTKSYGDYIIIAMTWTLLAIILDYLFIVKLLHPADGYYKTDVYLYYLLTCLLPLFVGWRRKESSSLQHQTPIKSERHP